jgi:peptidoglycan hydrolase-like protein with peptidoglycan-binding domain
MRTWKSVLALSVVGALLATTAVAQTTSPQQTPKAEPSKPDASGPSSSPSTSSPSTSSPSPSTGAADKAGAEKSDTMKSSSTGKGEPAARGGNQEQVRAAQQALKDKGHDPGAIDGVLGTKTQAALRDFQKKEGLKESGRLDAQTMAKLGVESSSPAASPQTGTGGSSSSGASPSAPSSEMGKGSSSSKGGSGAMGKTDSGMKDKK